MFCKGWLSFTKLFGCFQFKAFVYGSIFLSKNGKLVIFLFSEGPRRSFLSALGEGGGGVGRIPEFLNHIMASCSTDEVGSIPFDVCDER